MQNSKLSAVNFLALLALSFIFSLSVRYIWINQFKDVESFKWNNELMINTNDGYAYAEGARDMLQGFHQENDLSYADSSLSTTTAFLAKIVPISFETLLLWMPAIFGSFLVIPLMLIARSLNQDYMGFVAALLGSIAWSYYNRTMIGYYDTDMLVIVLPTFLLWSLIFNVAEQKNRYLPLIPLFLMLNSWWYGQSYSLNMAMIGIAFIYAMVFERKNLFFHKMLIFMLLAIAGIFLWLKIILMAALFLAFHFKKELFNSKIIFYILVGVSLLVLATGGFTPILAQIKGYVFREAYASDIYETMKLNYFAVNQTVREAGQIPFETFANRISGHTVTFLLSVIGYVLLSLRYRVMWLALPMVGLGFLALKGGLRFTVYAVPPMALGASYLLFFMASKFETFVFNDTTLRNVKIAFISLGTVAILYPNVKHAQEYKVPTVFNQEEVKVLDALGKKAGREDYVVSWWDYGYPIRYYADVKTLLDGGKHIGKVNFPVSFVLLNDQISAANMARLDVEYTEKSYKDLFDSNLIQEMKDYNFTDVEDLLVSMQSTNFALPQKTRDVFLYLPNRMMSILPTVDLFSNLDLKTGAQKARPLFYTTNNFKDAGDKILLGGGIELFKSGGKLKIGAQTIPLHEFVVTQYNQQGKLEIKRQVMNAESQYSVIFMKNYNQFLVLDKRLENSTYIKLFVLEEYDSSLYEPVILTPLAKVYKLKK